MIVTRNNNYTTFTKIANHRISCPNEKPKTNRLLRERSRLHYIKESSLEDFLFGLDSPVVVRSCGGFVVISGTLVSTGSAVETTLATISAGTTVIAAIKSTSTLSVPARATVITTGTAIASGA